MFVMFVMFVAGILAQFISLPRRVLDSRVSQYPSRHIQSTVWTFRWVNNVDGSGDFCLTSRHYTERTNVLRGFNSQTRL
jgi:hypothetical protein